LSDTKPTQLDGKHDQLRGNVAFYDYQIVESDSGNGSDRFA